MPGRKVAFVSGGYYHIFNRGVEKRSIFTQAWDYQRFIKTSYYYQFLGPKPSFSKFSKSELNLFKPLNENKIIEIICYCLMPNHFHFLVKQLKENGVAKFISQLSNSYTKYFNTKYQRVGALFQGVFAGVSIDTDEQLVHLSRYIHLNPVVSEVVKNLNEWNWSSYLEYLTQPKLCNTSEILNFFSSQEKYMEFLEAQIDLGTTLEVLKHKVIEEV